MNDEKDHTERRYTEKEVSKTVEKVISEMLERGEIADTRAHNGSSAGNAGAICLLTKIADLVDNEDAGEPLDDAIRWANETLAILNEPQRSATNVEVPTDALINLVNYHEQCDEDGAKVKVSRQALAEVLVYVQLVRPDLNGEPQPAAVREALELAEDVLSRAPFSTAIWPNGMHPNRGIEKIRAAIRSRDLPQRSAGNECELRECLSGCAQILDVVKQEWSAENAWTEWDQSVRDSITAAVRVLNEPQASADTAHVLNEWADLGSNALQWLKNIKDGISTAEQALEDMQFDYDRVLALSRAVPQQVKVMGG